MVLLLSVLLVSSCRGEDFCKNKICPEFTVTKSNQVGLRSGQAGRHSPEESRKVISMLLCLQDFEIHEFVPTTWIRTQVEGTSNSEFLKANGRLKSFAQNGEGVFVPETCYFAVS